MQSSFEGFRKAGSFVVTLGIEVQGELILKGDQTSLDLYSKEFFNTHDLKDGCITGVFLDRSKVSLVDCMTTQGPGSGFRGSEHYHFSSVFPHLAIFGDEHIKPSERKIVEVSFLLDDAGTIFYDVDAFGSVFDGRALMERIAESKKVAGRDIAVGEHPHIFYFTGKREILAAKTTLGTLSVTHNYSYSMPGPNGIKLENNIYVNVAFKEAATVDQALESVHTLLGFLEVLAGRPQRILRLMFRLSSTGDIPAMLEVYSCMAPSRGGDPDDRKAHPRDLPIQAAQTPDHFVSVLSNWLARHHTWRNARFRFSSSFACQHNYTIDRIVGAANMFDILPASATPAPVVLAKDVVDAQKAARNIFKCLPESPERQSVLDALGRLGTISLRRKIQSRAQLILDVIPECFPELHLVIASAVDCRNHFVHGSTTKIDYSSDFDQVIFFTDALEFIFAASDLKECGWDIRTWSKQSGAASHPFDRFRHGYKQSLTRLKTALTC